MLRGGGVSPFQISETINTKLLDKTLKHRPPSSANMSNVTHSAGYLPDITQSR